MSKADNIRRAAPFLVALLEDYNRSKLSDATAHGASERPADSLRGERDTLVDRRAS